MSYLTLQNGIPDFSKAVISFWFRIPEESRVAAIDRQLSAGVEGFFIFQKTLPLVTFGRPQKNKNYTPRYENVLHVTGSVGGPFIQMEPVEWVSGPNYDVDPCFVGIVVKSDGKMDLAINLQMENDGTYSGHTYFVTNITIVIHGDGSQTQTTEIVDGSYFNDAQPELFYIETDIGLKTDQWHHLLLSFDVSGSMSGDATVTSSCQLWYAIDDKDYRGVDNMQPFREAPGEGPPPDFATGDGLGPNDIMTHNIWTNYGPQTQFEFHEHHLPSPVSTYSPTPIPSEGAELGIPASSKYADAILRVEMAEFQMWTGVTLDTGIESNRRAFVDEDGKPVKPTEGATEDDPRGRAEKLLGKKPEILLHGSSNWKTGYNTGTTGVTIVTEVDEDGKVIETITKIPSGQFTPTALIEKYKPEPALENVTA